jgi:Uncharacterized protein conserved in bacteria (DUF2062)
VGLFGTPFQKGSMKETFLQRRVRKPLVKLLLQGVTPKKLALSLALSATLAVIPAFGWSVWLCGLAGLAFGLNLPAMQAVNYFLYPAQIALLLPFFRLGEKLFRAPHLPLSVPQIVSMAHANFLGAVRLLWSTTWHAVVAWALLAPFAAGLMYLVLLPIFRRAANRKTATPPATEPSVA